MSCQENVQDSGQGIIIPVFGHCQAQGKCKHFYKEADGELPRNKLVISWQSESMQQTNCGGSREKPLDPPDLQILEKGFPASPQLQVQYMGQRAPNFQPQRLNFFFWLSNKMEGKDIKCCRSGADCHFSELAFHYSHQNGRMQPAWLQILAPMLIRHNTWLVI